jgi:predicted RNA binding protein YcfA (HicA-like mRNA interferase family)
MPKLVPITAKKLSSMLLALGFVERDAEGSHVFFKHPDGRTTTVPMHTKELSRGLLRKILNDIEVSRDEYEKLRGKL